MQDPAPAGRKPPSRPPEPEALTEALSKVSPARSVADLKSAAQRYVRDKQSRR